WVDQMQKELVTLADTATAEKNLYTVEQNDAEELVARAARNIEQLLRKRSAALEKLATAAENFQMEHQWKDEFEVMDTKMQTEKTCISTWIASSICKFYVYFKEDPSFKRLTDYNHTAVHVPTDIYDGATIVLNELNWTKALEDVFRKNREDDPTLLWQVFGSATGLARYYPASPWMDARKTPSKIDLYDVRRRPWYIQGAASPKDMLILVDASGSVSGLTLKLIRTSVSEMLETLSDDDYVNVVYFNTRVKKTACFDHLVQANVRNKKLLKDAVQNITILFDMDCCYGFDLMMVINKFLVYFLSQAILEKYNADKKALQCELLAFIYIPSIGAIRINTQEYLDVLGRPMVLADKQAKQVQWTNVYLDALELGLVITGTLPVFNKTKTRDDRNGENQLILGVMAIDVSLLDIKKLTPRFTIGPNGYYFAIDPNGYVLLHPNLQPKNPKFQEPVTLDFLDAELENDIKVKIRRMMIDGEIGERTIQTLVKTQDERYIDRGVRTYTWAPVNGTDYRCFFMCSKAMETIQLERFDEFGYTYIAPREYCKDLKLSPNNTQFLLDFNEYIDRNTPDSCEDGIVARFVATDGGITRVYPRSAGEDWTENPETYESSFYKRTLDNEIYIFTAPSFTSKFSERLMYVYGFCAWGSSVWSGTEPILLSAFGRHPNPTVKLFISFILQHVDCVILDDGGFLLMSNQDEYITLIGQFFGEVDPVLMINLVNTSLYSFNKTYDYQSVCDPEKDNKAAAGPRSIYVPTIADLLSIGWWASSASADEDIPDAMFKESCITEQTQYFFDNEERSYSGVLDCGNCSRMYRAEKLPNANLVFLITDAKATCLSCDPRPLRQAEQPSVGPDPCELAQNPRYRKGPDVCFDNNENVISLCQFLSGFHQNYASCTDSKHCWLPALPL
uniref:VWFA domain-containing protein n=1 Tax=Anabas testudineus TaxID=64144 RepID=A0AAQ6IUA9_ANATE